MERGEKLFGFQVMRVRRIEELEADMYELEHEKTGASLVWLDREDENKTFLVGFQTLPEDDTGVFHILEHSVLCGSRKYPVKEPFVELLKSSMNTFLNAMTYPDKTVYPVSSRNETDFMNLVSVYLDAVFSPAIYENPNIFRQEGWHYEVEASSSPSFKGVVFNEMKGAFSSVDETLEIGMSAMLYPQTCYRFVSGGDPAHIPDLTYEQFLAAHKRFYHPSNAKIFLDGTLPTERVLRLLDEEYLSRYDRQQPDFTLHEQPLTAAQTQTRQYAISPGEDRAHKAYFAMGRLAGSWKERNKLLALNVLCDYFTGSQDAPLKRAVLEAGLGQNAFLELSGEIAQPWVGFIVENTDPECFDKLEQVYYETLKKAAEEGLDKKVLEASVNQLEFRSRERKEPQGLILGLSALESWLYGGDPALYLAFEESFAALREKLSSDYFEELIRELLLDQEHISLLKVLPSHTLNREMEEREKERLNRDSAGWTAEERARLEEETGALLRWQQQPDPPEALETLPLLSLSDVSPEPLLLEAEIERERETVVLKSPSAAAGVVYLNLYFSLADLDLEDFSSVSLWAALLGALPTEKYTVAELDREIKGNLGALSFRAVAFSQLGEAGACRPYLLASCRVLREKTKKAVELLREILLHTRLEEPDRIREILLQIDTASRQGIITSGHSCAMLRALSHHSAVSAVQEAIMGFTGYKRRHAFAADFEGKKEGFIEKCRSFRDKALCASRLTLGVSGELSPEDLKELVGSFPQGEPAGVFRVEPSGPCKEGIIIPSEVSYASLGGNLSELGAPYSGPLQVASAILSYQYLWNAIRVQGGAYGAGFAVGESGSASFYSYRDPSPVGALSTFDGSAGFLEEFRSGDEKLEPRIVGAVAAMEPLLSPAAKAQAICECYFRGVTTEERRRVRGEMLSMSKEDLKEPEQVLLKLSQLGSRCVVGPESAFAGLDREQWDLMEL